MPSSRNSSSDKSKSKKAPDISKLAKLTPTKIPKTWRTAPSRASAGDLAVNVVRAEKVNWKKLVGFSAVIFLAVFLLYGWSLNGSYVFNDSINYSVLTTANSDSEFLTTALNRAFIYPLTEPWVRLTYALDSISFPKAIAYFHLVNISLHAVACIYLYLFVVQFVRWLRLDERTRIDPYLTGLLAALLLACHPLSTGAAAYISGRGPLLVAGNYFLCLNLFLLGFNSESLLVLICYYLLCLVFMAMGLFSGALGITIPMSITALIFLLKPTTVKLREWLSERWMDAMVFGSIALGFLFTLRFARPPILDNGVDLNLLSPLAYVATEAKVLVTYFLRCFIVPAGLSVAPPLANASGLSDPLALAGLVTMAAMIAGLWWLRNNTFLFFATLLTVLGLLPNFLVVQHEVVSDQRFYVGLSGLCLIFSWLAVTLISQAQDKTSAAGTATSESKLNVPLAASISVLIILSGLTLWRESSWLKPDSVWQQASMLNSTDARAVGMLADDYRLRGQNEKAVELANQALKLDPDCPPAWEALGENQVSLRQYGPAQSYLQRAYDEATKRKTAEDKLSLYTTNLAEACALNHDWSKAKLYAQQALVVRPMNAVLHVALGQSLLNENQPFLALQELNRVARIDPTNPDYLEPMADAALKVGGRQYVELALNIAYRAMRVKLSSHANLEFVRAALELGRVQAAMTRLEKILPKEPTNAEALLCMSYAMHLLGQENPAHDWEKRALAIDPHIKEKIKLKPVDKEAEHPTDIDRGGASTKALSAPAKPGATLAPAKPGATSAPAKPGATSAPAKPGATSPPAKP